MTAKQFKGWAAYYALEPFGDLRADLRAGIIAATVRNRLRGKNENATEPADFMPFFEKPAQTTFEILSVIRQAKAEANGTRRRHLD